MPKETLTTRVALIEDRFKTVVEPMANDVKEIRTMLYDHVTQPKDNNGKKINRRKLSMFQKIMITIALVGLLGGSTLLKALWDEVDRLVDKQKVSRSNIE